MKKISQKDAKKLLELAAEMSVILRSNGYHWKHTLVDADTDKKVAGPTTFDNLQEHIICLRNKLK
jgi:hypothetical protein